MLIAGTANFSFLKIDTPKSGFSHILNLRKYPAMMAYYVVGIGVLCSNNKSVLEEITTHTIIHPTHDGKTTIFNLLRPSRVIHHSLAANLFTNNRKFPINDYIFQSLIQLLPSDIIIPSFEEVFDQFEIFLSIYNLNLQLPPDFDLDIQIAPILGCFAYKENEMKKLIDDTELNGLSSCLGRTGLFSDMERLVKILKLLDNFLVN
tara:strand:- start:2126 stop:2740 length:615 start_codon:yes stop_codon:yes gene_type:complete